MRQKLSFHDVREQQGYRTLAKRLRKEWLTDWQAGRKIPSFGQLRRKLNTTCATLQRAMDLLSRQGFIVSRPRVGSYLAEAPPHTSRIALLFKGHPQEVVSSWQWSREHLATLLAAQAMNAANGAYRLSFYTDVSEGTRPSASLARLLQDVGDRTLAGLIFSYSPETIKTLTLLQHPPLPIIHYNPNFSRPGMAVCTGLETFSQAVAEKVQRSGRQRVAFLCRPQSDPERVRASFASMGLELRPEWLLPVDPFRPQWLPHVLAALFSQTSCETPDVLVIGDDHMVEPALDALKHLSPRNLDDLLIVGHWNFPVPCAAVLPVELIGFDANAWLDAAVGLIASNAEAPYGDGKRATIALRESQWIPHTRPSNPSIKQLLHKACATLTTDGQTDKLHTAGHDGARGISQQIAG